MAVLSTALDPRCSSYLERRSVTLERLEAGAAVSRAPDAGARELVELLVDRDTPLLELSGSTSRRTGVVTAIGVIGGALCLIAVDDHVAAAANGATSAVPDGSVMTPAGALLKIARAAEIARANRLPVVRLVNRTNQHSASSASDFCPVYTIYNDITNLSIEQVNSTIREIRHTVTRLAGHTRTIPSPVRPIEHPLHSEVDLLAVAPCQPEDTCEPREILARLLDGSDFEDWVAERVGSASSGGGDVPEEGGVRVGWGAIHGHTIGIIADSGLPQHPDHLVDALRFIQIVENEMFPLILISCGTGSSPLMNRDSPLVRAILATRVPKISLSIGPETCPGHGSRFHFRWPSAAGDDWDDGTIDPRDTRTVIGLCLAVFRGATHAPLG